MKQYDMIPTWGIIYAYTEKDLKDRHLYQASLTMKYYVTNHPNAYGSQHSFFLCIAGVFCLQDSSNETAKKALIHIFLRRLGYLGHFFSWPKHDSEDKPNCTSTSQASASVTSAHIPLAKASLKAKAEAKGRGYTCLQGKAMQAMGGEEELGVIIHLHSIKSLNVIISEWQEWTYMVLFSFRGLISCSCYLYLQINKSSASCAVRKALLSESSSGKRTTAEAGIVLNVSAGGLPITSSHISLV